MRGKSVLGLEIEIIEMEFQKIDNSLNSFYWYQKKILNRRQLWQCLVQAIWCISKLGQWLIYKINEVTIKLLARNHDFGNRNAIECGDYLWQTRPFVHLPMSRNSL